jgi:hypothetical protein
LVRRAVRRTWPHMLYLAELPGATCWCPGSGSRVAGWGTAAGRGRGRGRGRVGQSVPRGRGSAVLIGSCLRRRPSYAQAHADSAAA